MTLATRERPILFSGPMVKAILPGVKTQTRRVVGLDVPDDADEVFAWFGGDLRDAPNGCAPDGLWARRHGVYLRHIGACPYGSPGDRLWVRETYAYTDETINETPGFVYRATDPDWSSMEGFKWRPSIFMPRRASRITLEITDVRVQCLNEISEEDARAEGINDAFLVRNKLPGDATLYAFRHLWDEINGDRQGCNWDDNPWVWAISFKRLTKERQ